jgi:hypothetical protein
VTPHQIQGKDFVAWTDIGKACEVPAGKTVRPSHQPVVVMVRQRTGKQCPWLWRARSKEAAGGTVAARLVRFRLETNSEASGDSATSIVGCG